MSGKVLAVPALLVLVMLASACATLKGDDGWICLFDGKTLVDWTQSASPPRIEYRPEYRLSIGTIALQGYDPGSTVYYRNIMIKPLPR